MNSNLLKVGVFNDVLVLKKLHVVLPYPLKKHEVCHMKKNAKMPYCDTKAEIHYQLVLFSAKTDVSLPHMLEFLPI